MPRPSPKSLTLTLTLTLTQVSATSLAKELQLAEKGHEREMAAVMQRAADALSEASELQAAGEQAHALCEAFDGQMRALSRDLTERDVSVCILLAELRADDMHSHATAGLSRSHGGAAHTTPAGHTGGRAFTYDATGKPQRLLNTSAGALTSCAATPKMAMPSGIPMVSSSRRGTPQRGPMRPTHARGDGIEAGGRIEAGGYYSSAPPSTVASPPDMDRHADAIGHDTTHDVPASSLVAPPSHRAVATPPPIPHAMQHLAWEVPRLQHELHAALGAAAAAQRSASAAEEMAAQQQASFALNLRRERERLRSDHQAEVARIYKQIGDLQSVAAAIKSPEQRQEALRHGQASHE